MNKYIMMSALIILSLSNIIFVPHAKAWKCLCCSDVPPCPVTHKGLEVSSNEQCMTLCSVWNAKACSSTEFGAKCMRGG